MSLVAIKYERGSLQLLDQRLLPAQFTYLDSNTPNAAWQHIKDMVVRGAPAIGVTGVLALSVDLVANKGAGAAFTDVQEAVAYIRSTLDYLVTSRPTAVNLAEGADRMRDAAESAAAAADASPSSVVEAVVQAAEAYFAADVSANKALGAYGASALLAAAASRPRGLRLGGKLRVLTHCNTGSLATAGYGTALGIIRALHEQGKLEQVYCTETRPYNQGARLTAFELVHDGLPATLVCDSATAHLMSSGQVDAVVVGADRVVANGDTANKIGTYMLSIVAAHHDVPFFVAAPTTTLDPCLPCGAAIEIEQRPAEEMTHFKGQRVVVEGIQVWNPCFDVAPAPLITGIITEKGAVPKEGASFKVAEFLGALGLLPPSSPPGPLADQSAAPPAALVSHPLDTVKAEQPEEGSFYALDESKVTAYIQSKPQLLALLGAPGPGGYNVREVGDGNINFVYVVTAPGSSAGLVLKQSLPYPRCVGESWPLTQDRLRIEAAALREERRCCPDHVPEVYCYDGPMATMAMQYIAPPAIILRKGLIKGVEYPALADHLSDFLACTLFGSSLLALAPDEYRRQLLQFSNPDMCELTEKLIFTEPYMPAHYNRHTSPQLDQDVKELQADSAAKVAVGRLKHKFMAQPEALIHGDLHTGSIMVTAELTQVIDPEFAFYGPMAFDIAKILANLLLALFASPGHEQQNPESPPRQQHRNWLLQCVDQLWSKFAAKFTAKWSSHSLAAGSCPGRLMGPDAPASPEALRDYQESFMAQLWLDVVGFMGAFFIRRIVGMAHVEDLESIADPDLRAACERRALSFGRKLLVQPQAYPNMQALLGLAKTTSSVA